MLLMPALREKLMLMYPMELPPASAVGKDAEMREKVFAEFELMQMMLALRFAAPAKSVGRIVAVTGAERFIKSG